MFNSNRLLESPPSAATDDRPIQPEEEEGPYKGHKGVGAVVPPALRAHGNEPSEQQEDPERDVAQAEVHNVVEALHSTVGKVDQDEKDDTREEPDSKRHEVFSEVRYFIQVTRNQYHAHQVQHHRIENDEHEYQQAPLRLHGPDEAVPPIEHDPTENVRDPG